MDPDPDPAYNCDADPDPDPTFQFDADPNPDPQHSFCGIIDIKFPRWNFFLLPFTGGLVGWYLLQILPTDISFIAVLWIQIRIYMDPHQIER